MYVVEKVAKLFLIVAIMFFGEHILANDFANGFIDFAETQKPRIDIDNDGTPDILRFYNPNNNKLQRMVYRPSQNPSHWYSETYPSDAVKIRKTYIGAMITEEETEERSENGYKLNTIKYKNGEAVKKTVEVFQDKTQDTRIYKKSDKGWVLVSRDRKTLGYVYRETTEGGYSSGVSEEDYENREDRSPLVLRLSNSCQGEDREMFIEATHYLFKRVLPCVHRYHPQLAFAIAYNASRYRNVIQCNAFNSDGVVARTLTMRNAPIEWGTYASPSAVRRNPSFGMNETQAVNFIANSMMHEMLHHFGIRHLHGVRDAAYGCETLCALTPQPLSYQEGCQICLNTTVNGQRSQTSQNACRSRNNDVVSELTNMNGV